VFNALHPEKHKPAAPKPKPAVPQKQPKPNRTRASVLPTRSLHHGSIPMLRKINPNTPRCIAPPLTEEDFITAWRNTAQPAALIKETSSKRWPKGKNPHGS
jgi:hypothetical protein